MLGRPRHPPLASTGRRAVRACRRSRQWTVRAFHPAGARRDRATASGGPGAAAVATEGDSTARGRVVERQTRERGPVRVPDRADPGLRTARSTTDGVQKSIVLTPRPRPVPSSATSPSWPAGSSVAARSPGVQLDVIEWVADAEKAKAATVAACAPARAETRAARPTRTPRRSGSPTCAAWLRRPGACSATTAAAGWRRHPWPTRDGCRCRGGAGRPVASPPRTSPSRRPSTPACDAS